MWTKYGLDKPETADSGFLEFQMAALLARSPLECTFLGELFSLEKFHADAMFLFNLVPEFSMAQWRLGLMYRDAEGVEQDLVKAFSFFEKAANQGDPRAICDLGMCYRHGRGVEKDVKKGVALFRQGTDLGHVTSIYDLAIEFLYGEDGVEKDEAQAITLFTQAADLGHLKSLCRLGLIYRTGLASVPESRDPRKAVEYFLKGVEKDDPKSALYLAEMYLNGEGIERNVDQALHFFEMAANLGLAEAQRILGIMYVQGKEVPIDYEKAAKLFQSAADQGDNYSRYYLGVMYENGEGVEKDELKAADLFQRGANEGHSFSQYSLALKYLSGRPGFDDPAKGVFLLEQAANQGHLGAFLDLGGTLFARQGGSKRCPKGSGLHRTGCRDGGCIRAIQARISLAQRRYPSSNRSQTGIPLPASCCRAGIRSGQTQPWRGILSWHWS